MKESVPCKPQKTILEGLGTWAHLGLIENAPRHSGQGRSFSEPFDEFTGAGGGRADGPKGLGALSD